MTYNQTFFEHLGYLKSLFKKCQKGNLHLNLSKSTFCKTKISYLSFVVHEKGVKPQLAKNKSNQWFPVPEDSKAVRPSVGNGRYR